MGGEIHRTAVLRRYGLTFCTPAAGTGSKPGDGCARPATCLHGSRRVRPSTWRPWRRQSLHVNCSHHDMVRTTCRRSQRAGPSQVGARKARAARPAAPRHGDKAPCLTGSRPTCLHSPPAARCGTARPGTRLGRLMASPAVASPDVSRSPPLLVLLAVARCDRLRRLLPSHR